MMSYRSKRYAGSQGPKQKQNKEPFQDFNYNGASTDDTEHEMPKDELPRINGARANDKRNIENRRVDEPYKSKIPVGPRRIPNANRESKNEEEVRSTSPVRDRVGGRKQNSYEVSPRKNAAKSRNISKKVFFYRNGDKHFKGSTLIVTKQKYGSFESLEEDLSARIPLPYGVRYVFDMEGHLVTDINQLEDGGVYVCSSGDRLIQNINYGEEKLRQEQTIDTKPTMPSDHSSSSESPMSKSNETTKPRVITIYNSKEKTSKCKILLNSKTTKSYEDILKDISEMMKLKSHTRIKDLFTKDGTKVGGMSELFHGPQTYFAVVAPETVPKRNLSNPSLQSSEGLSPSQSRKIQRSRKKQRRDQQGNQQSITVRVKGKKLTYYSPTNNDRLTVDEDDDEAFSPPDAKPQLDWVYGYQGTQHNLHVLPSGEILYFISRIVVIYNKKSNIQRHYTGHADDIKCMAVHPNQWYIATGQASGLSLDQNEMSHIRLWDAETLITLVVLPLDDYSLSVETLAFSVEDNGKQLVCIDSNDDSFRLNLWEWEDRSLLTQSKELSAPVLDIAFDPDDSKTIVSCGKEHIYFWRWHNGKLERKNGYFEYPVPQYLTCMDFAPNGDICTGDSSGTVTVWGKVSKKIKFVVRNAHEKSILCLRVLPNGTLLTAGGVDGRVCAWDSNKYFTTPLHEAQLTDDMTGINALEPLLVEDSDDVTLLVGTTANKILEGSFTSDFIPLVKGHSDEVPALAVHPSKDLFISASMDKFAYLWSAKDHKTAWSTDVGFSIKCAAFYNTGSVVALGSTKGRWIVLDGQTGMHVCSFQDGTEPLTDIEYSPEGEHVAIASKDGNIYVHSVYDDGMTYRRVGCCSNHTAPVMFLDWSVDGCFIQSISTEYEHITWEIGAFQREESQNVIRDTEWNTRNVVLGYDVAGVWQSTPTEENLVTSSDLSWSHDLLAVGDELGYIRLFRYPCCIEGAQYHQVRAHSMSVARVLFLASDKFLLSTAGQDRAVLQWIMEGKMAPLAEEREDEPTDEQTPEQSEPDDYTSTEERQKISSENSDHDRHYSDYSDDSEYMSQEEELPTRALHVGDSRRRTDKDKTPRVHSEGNVRQDTRKTRNPTSYSEGDERTPRRKREVDTDEGRRRDRAPRPRKSFEDMFRKEKDKKEKPLGRGEGRDSPPRRRSDSQDEYTDDEVMIIPPRRLVRKQDLAAQKGGYASQIGRRNEPDREQPKQRVGRRDERDPDDEGTGRRRRGRGRDDIDRGRDDVNIGRVDRGRDGANRGRVDAGRGRGDADSGRGDADRGRGDVVRGRGDADRGRGDADRGRGDVVRGRENGNTHRGNRDGYATRRGGGYARK
ncbi:echinoderm microtubule-associated protein-like 4 isoform X2 [Nematostella vectensis]|uniref:echinoderm microtubule-associated protein-like 4 isoform X2 n=1 Tax=Nematostella vectensis TaxID=45351 RepID=UPI00207753AC|nr:echinoderm microtubule-associated protein-like 4 isoform X2 [Nematostella vectensis]